MDQGEFPIEKVESLFKSLSKNEVLLVAEVEKEIAGWGSLLQFVEQRPRAGYIHTASISIYAKTPGTGVGSELGLALINMSPDLGYHPHSGKNCRFQYSLH